MSELSKLTIEIEDLDAKIQKVRDSEAALSEASDAAQAAHTAALRRYAESPDYDAQTFVDEADTRLKEALKRQYTSGNSLKVLIKDRSDLIGQRDSLQAELEAENRNAAMSSLKTELQSLTGDIKQALVRYLALNAVTNGAPVGLGNIASLVDRDVKSQAQAEVAGIKQEWRSGNT